MSSTRPRPTTGRPLPFAFPSHSAHWLRSRAADSTHGFAGAWRRAGEDREQVADLLVAGKCIGERQLGVDHVGVASADALAGDVAGVGELGNDAVGGSFGDPDTLTDVAQTDAGFIGYADQYLGVVG